MKISLGELDRFDNFFGIQIIISDEVPERTVLLVNNTTGKIEGRIMFDSKEQKEDGVINLEFNKDKNIQVVEVAEDIDALKCDQE